MKTIIIEDNPLEETLMRHFIDNTEELEFVQAFNNCTDGLKYIEKEKIDLLFLDVELPDMTGIQMMDQMSFVPQIVITTSNKDYAFEAFEYEVSDFLKKPISPKRFQKTLEKVIANHERRNDVALASAAAEIYVKNDGKFTRVPYEDILYFENVGDYIKVITESGMHIIYGALKTLAERLKHPRFLKVHRSYIVNLDKIGNIEDNSLLIGKKVIPISRAHKPVVMGSINIL